MKAKSILTIIVATCLLSAVFWPSLVTTVKAASTTIYVNVQNANDPAQDGSAAHPFGSIQKGVDATSPGDTVQVAAGVYYGEVDINESYISLVGQLGSTIIDGNGTGATGIRVYHWSPYYTEDTSISGFTVRNFIRGITLSRSIGLVLRDNTMVNNTYNFGDYTLQIHDIDTSNTVDGKPIYFWANQHDKQVPADAGFVELADCTNMAVKDLNLTNGVQGMVLKNTTNSLVENVRITNDWDGLYLETQSKGNTIIDSTVSNNLFMGIYVSTSSNNTFNNNSITDNAYGLFLDSTVFEYVIGFQPTGNTVTGNIIWGNTVANCSTAGVYSLDTENNLFYDNNFVNNSPEVYNLNSTNLWDNGAEGNYLTDYSGQDSNKTGLGNTPYVIDENNTDNHPLMGPFLDFPATWQDGTYPVTAISNSTVSDFYFSQPEKTLGFSVNPRADSGTGFCRVAVPVNLLGGPYSLFIDGLPSTNLFQSSNGTYSFLYLSFNDSHHDIKIEGTSVVSEFPTFFLVLLLAVITAGVVMVAFKRRKSTPALFG
jgi:parallel beta-helix repeat protein